MDDELEGYALTEKWEELASRFKPSSNAVITVSLSADEARYVRDAMISAVAYLEVELENDRLVGQRLA